MRVRLNLVAQLGVKLRQQQVRIDVVGVDLKCLLEPLDRDIEERARFRLPTLPVVDAPEAARATVLVGEPASLLEHRNRIVEPAHPVVRHAERLIGIERRGQCQRSAKRGLGVLVAAHIQICGTEERPYARVVGCQLDGLPELLGGLFVSTLLAIEGREPRATGPVARPAFHRTLVSLFCRVEVAQVFFGKCKPQEPLVAELVGLERLLVGRPRIGVLTRAVRHHPQAHMRGREVLVDLERLAARLARPR